MSHFYGTIEGNARTCTNRCGTKKSGIQGHIRGWDLGGHVRLDYSYEKAVDILHFTLTGGSNQPGLNRGLTIRAWFDKYGKICSEIHNETNVGESESETKV